MIHLRLLHVRIEPVEPSDRSVMGACHIFQIAHRSNDKQKSTSATMVSKYNRRRNGNNKRSKWPYIIAGIVILVAILWKDAAETSVNEQCTLILAESAIPNAGFGIFTLTPIVDGQSVNHGELVIQVPDLLAEYKREWNLLLDRYMWDSKNGGGGSESARGTTSVHSIMAGIGMLSNGHPQWVNVGSVFPDVDNGGISRHSSPGAGGSTHYHNVKWIATRLVNAGEEILLHYGSNYDSKITYGQHDVPRKPVEHLRETGMCLDNIRPGDSPILHAGRGAFANRPIANGTLIAPAPLAVFVNKDALRTSRIVTDPLTHEKRKVRGQQLMLNYCFGHPNSSMLFYPYSSIVNFINHDSIQPNARLKWSESPLHSGREWLNWTLEEVKQISLNRTGLLLEIVATRDIQQGEEILLDYGSEWETAWNEHVANWKPAAAEDDYTYASNVDLDSLLNSNLDSLSSLPSNLQVMCRYHYSERAHEAGGDGSFSVRWKESVSAIKTLRPCRIIRKDASGGFTAEMFNLGNDDAIPEQFMPHVVTDIPRSVIEVRDKPYHSDQHLEFAFRHEIGIPDEIFPKQWMDL